MKTIKQGILMAMDNSLWSCGRFTLWKPRDLSLAEGCGKIKDVIELLAIIGTDANTYLYI